METYQILSRRAGHRVDFSPDQADGSPDHQLRRISAFLRESYIGPDEISDCDTALKYLREYTYRKIFTGTTHEQFLFTNEADPTAVDWLIAIAATDAAAYQYNKRKENKAQ